MAVRVPAAVGEKTTGMLAVPPLARTLRGVAGVGRVKPAAKPKSPGLVPLKARAVICKAAVPELVTVKGRGALEVPTCWLVAKLSGLGLAAKAGAAVVPPVPDRGMEWEPPEALSLETRLAVRAPLWAGVK